MQSEEINPTEKALSTSREASLLIALIDETLILLSQKRRTLEEKAIAGYFHRLSSRYALLISSLHEFLASGDSVPCSAAEVFSKLQEVNENVRLRVEELLKTVKYNLNFLEQYFEYDYCAKLLYEDNFLADLESFHCRLEESIKA